MNLWRRINSSVIHRTKLWVWGSTAAMALYLALGAVLGFDVCDTGQYMTMYANIFTSPESVGYHFMYYLSGVVGGAALAAMPWMGVLGMRLLGIACLAVCMLTVWRTLKPHITPTAIVAGNVISMVAFVALPVTLCYDILSITLYLLAIEQLLKPRALAVAVGGFLLGINAFSRTPNVLGFVFALTPLLAAWCEGETLKNGARRSAWAALGVICGVGAMVAMMHCLGHFSIFTDNLATLRRIAADGSAESTHGIGALIGVQLSFYRIEFLTWLKLGTVIGVYTILRRRIGTPWARLALLACALAAAVWMMWRMEPLQPLWALCAFGCLTAICTCRGPQRATAALALALMLIFPMGSDSAYNNGSIIAMLAAPIAVAMCMRHTQMFRAGYFIAAFALVCVGKMATGGAYFDGGPLWQKTAPIHSTRAAGILTTAERAAVVNEALQGIKPWVGESDTMLVFGSMPMLNYLTATHPAISCCWPELLTTAMLNERLQAVRSCPIVLRQKFTSIGQRFSAPTDAMLHTYGKEQSVFCTDSKIGALNRFLSSRHYRKVWESPHFVLYLPPGKLPPHRHTGL